MKTKLNYCLHSSVAPGRICRRCLLPLPPPSSPRSRSLPQPLPPLLLPLHHDATAVCCRPVHYRCQRFRCLRLFSWSFCLSTAGFLLGFPLSPCLFAAIAAGIAGATAVPADAAYFLSLRLTLSSLLCFLDAATSWPPPPLSLARPWYVL